jgi:hypothetical protein
MNAAKIKLLTDSELAACDALDGLVDRIISKYGACRHDLSTLRCPGGIDTGNTCLSDRQIAAVKALRNPYMLPFPIANGQRDNPGWGVQGGESNPEGWDRWQMGTNPMPEPQPPGPGPFPGVATIPFYGQTLVRYFIAQNDAFDTYYFNPIPYKNRIKYVSPIVDSTNPHISAFMERGGKLLMKENTADYARAAYMGMDYYESVVAKLGHHDASSFTCTPGGSTVR